MKINRLTGCLLTLSLTVLSAFNPAASAQEPVIFQPDGLPDPTFDVPPGLNLKYALAFALDNNFAIRQAKERIRQQEGVVVEVKSSQIPNVSASAGYSRNADEVSTNGYDYAWSFGVTARQVLFSGGGVSASVRGQEAAREAAILALQAVINDALFDVRTRFYTVIVNRERIKVQEQNIELLQRQLQDVKN
ncbi:MAG: TolC family protein, partial [Limisphaerales bacterium]